MNPSGDHVAGVDVLDPYGVDEMAAGGRRGLAIEPMTCAPNALVTGAALRVLQPEESWTTVWGIAAEPAR